MTSRPALIQFEIEFLRPSVIRLQLLDLMHPRLHVERSCRDLIIALRQLRKHRFNIGPLRFGKRRARHVQHRVRQSFNAWI